MNIAIIEDHLMMRDILRQTCTKDFGHVVVAEAGKGTEAIAVITQTHPDLVILDLQLPDLDGLAVLAAIRAKGETCRVLVLSSYCNNYTIYLIEKARVDGFVDKNSNTVSSLRVALTAIASGGCHFSKSYNEIKAARRRDPNAFDKILTDREQTVLTLIGRLMTDREIAENLRISIQTAAKHRFNILKKLALPSTIALARYARDHGFSQGLTANLPPRA